LVASGITGSVIAACGGIVSGDDLPNGPGGKTGSVGPDSTLDAGWGAGGETVGTSGGSAPTAPSGGTESRGDTGGAAGSDFATGGIAGCAATIDDMEDGTGHICPGEGRDGVWYAFNDRAGTQWPAPTTPGIPIETSLIPGGRGPSLRAMHTYGDGFLWAGIGLDLGFDGTTYGLYDAGAYDGITFWARGNGVVTARVGTALTTSTQWGGTCTLDTPPVAEGCVPHDSGYALLDEWVQYWLPFDLLTAVSQGDRTEAPFDRTELTNIQFRVGGAFDFWIDDVSFFVGPPACCSPRPAGCEGTNLFPDPDLKSAVGAGDLACEDVCFRQALTAGPYTPPAGIRDLQGLQCLLDLRGLGLGGNQVSDLGPLAGLTRLAGLGLSHNQVSDLGPLAGLTRMASLYLADNLVGEIGALSGLTELCRLDLSQNQIVDVGPLLPLTKLSSLDLSDNQVRVVSGLSTLTALYELKLPRNQVEDISPLGALDHLNTLDLSDNQIRDVAGLSGLDRLGTLNLAGNQIDTISHPFVLDDLWSLDLSRNLLRDVTGLGDLPSLSSLDLSQNQIADLGSLSGLASYTLDLSHNQISDLGPISGLGKVTILYLSDNQVSDLGPLSVWTAATELAELGLANNRITDLPSLGNLSALSTVDLSGNQIVDVSPLASLPNLFVLKLNGNRIADLAPLLGFSGLEQRNYDRGGLFNATVDLSGNPIDCAEQAANMAALRAKPVNLTIDCP
jgi:internalin A